MRTQVGLNALGALLDGHHENPFEVLGPHEVVEAGRRALAVRAMLPGSQQAWVVDLVHGSERPMRRIHPAGVFEALCPAEASPKAGKDYVLRVSDQRGERTTMHDPYAFPPMLTDYDLYLFGEGRHFRIYERLGAHSRSIDGVTGVNFAVWAPNASGVSVIGDFNGWDGRRHPMRKHTPSGVWELFVPGTSVGSLYKYRIRRHGETTDRSDPYGLAAELPPRTASIVCNVDDYEWRDDAWMAQREKRNGLAAPVSVYEVHLGSWRRPSDDPSRWLTYRELADTLIPYCTEMGYTHIELMPV